LNNLTRPGSISSASSFGIAGNLDVGGSFSATAGNDHESGAAKVISRCRLNRPHALNASGSISSTNNFSIRSDLSVSGALTARGYRDFQRKLTLSGTANLFNVTPTAQVCNSVRARSSVSPGLS